MITPNDFFLTRHKAMLVLVASAMFCQVSLAVERPNIVFMMSDDQAWNGLSVPMHPGLE